ncbi:MAG TPA: flagellar basal body rod protein FlgC [Gemmatimonadaceae bacterium]|nr:flagellar basal body rod protein FlgC [Gemmatimonadaceae bacterium]
MPITPAGKLPMLPFAGVSPRTPGADIRRTMFRTLEISAGGLSAQRLRMEVSAENIANAETTRTPEGGPYRRKVVGLANEAGTPATALPPEVQAATRVAMGALGSMLPFAGDADAIYLPATPAEENGVVLTGVAEDQTEGAMVYDPGHPDANQSGYVRMPNVNVTQELVDLMSARRIYEANATVFQSAKAMLRRAIDI